MRPDILFILSDQHTRKIAGCYGDALADTPHLDRLAENGVVFEQAYCPSPICVPSRMSMLTGRWPHEQRCWTLTDSLSDDIPTYAHALGAAGYQTLLCGRLHAIGADQLHGFSARLVGDCSPNWIGAKRQNLGMLAGAQGPQPPASGGGVGSTVNNGADVHSGAISLRLAGCGQSGYEVVDDATTRAACEQLATLGEARRRGDDTPFLLQVGYLLPHCPFVARDDDFGVFRGRVSTETLARSNNEHPYLGRWRNASGIDRISQQDKLNARTAYYGLVRALDRKIGTVLDALEQAGLVQNTLIVYASDHGEQLGDRDLWWKNTFYEESAGVPLLISWPGVVPSGRRSARIVNLVDVGATLLDLAGAPALARSHGRSLKSISLSDQAPWIEQTYSEYVTDLESGWMGGSTTRQRMVRHGRWKLVYIDGYRPQLYDLLEDPHESSDLGEHPGYQSVIDWLTVEVLRDWHPRDIEEEVAARATDKQLLRMWAEATRPSSRFQFELSDKDSWLSR